ncbi:MAG: flippase [Candidatus Nanoarchaeia archaeon]
MKDVQGKIKRSGADIKEILTRLKKRDFSGYTGLAVKNSVYNTASTFVAKFGSLLFTIILARLLMPELFGLYALALSTIMIFSTFSDLGVGQTIIKFISNSQSNRKSKSYFSYLFKIKIILILISATSLLILSYPLAYYYFQKPIFYALLAGSLYLSMMSLEAVFKGLFHARNNFKKTFYNEALFQFFRLTLVPLIVFLSIGYVRVEFLLLFIFLSLSFCFFLSFLYIFISAMRKINFLKLKQEKLDKKEKKILNKFIIALSAMTVSSTLFGHIDMLILGRYVGSEFIGFYRAAYSLIISAAPLINFSGALFPLFSRLNGNKSRRGLMRSLKLNLLMSVPLSILVISIAPIVVKIVYGSEYLPSINILRIFSILIIILPVIGLFSSYLISQNKPARVAKSLIISTILNITLNYIFIISLLPYGYLPAVYGAAIATIISKFFYLGMLVWHKKITS